MELLLRMRAEDDELIPPGSFLGVAERFHLISRIDRWVMETARRWLVTLRGEDTILFINLSGRSIGDRVFQNFALGLLEEMDAPLRRRLVLEITETSMITHMPLAREFLDTIQRLGVNVALDDFGSGMAAFGYLKSLPLDYLKIDGQFVSSMLEDKLALAAVRAFIDVASVLEIPTIAEHVENEQVMQALIAMGVAYVQGYHVGRPMRADEVLKGVS
jgi:EAL domain-containing protein (putative c-di-GMP-specific phosphodiesterase class I)